jgi:hypothetical protein
MTSASVPVAVDHTGVATTEGYPQISVPVSATPTQVGAASSPGPETPLAPTVSDYVTLTQRC